MNLANQHILKLLIKAKNKPLSGEAIAHELGISRVAVWKRLESLEKEGFQFEAMRHQGYIMTATPEDLHEDLLRVHLEALGVKEVLFFYKTIDSTNVEAHRLLTQSITGPALVLAQKMSAGKGRLGRKWVADDTGNIYASFIFQPNRHPKELELFPLWIGLSICQWVKDTFGIEIKLKWPNDLVWQKRKLGGILIEATYDADATREMIVGIGFNVNTHFEDWPEDVVPKIASLNLIKNEMQDLHRVTAQFIKIIFNAYEAFMNGNFEENFSSWWPIFDALSGKTVTVKSPRETLEGVANGITSSGQLRLKLNDGSEAIVHAGDVSIGSFQMCENNL